MSKGKNRVIRSVSISMCLTFLASCASLPNYPEPPKNLAKEESANIQFVLDKEKVFMAPYGQGEKKELQPDLDGWASNLTHSASISFSGRYNVNLRDLLNCPSTFKRSIGACGFSDEAQFTIQPDVYEVAYNSISVADKLPIESLNTLKFGEYRFEAGKKYKLFIGRYYFSTYYYTNLITKIVPD